MLRPTDAQTAVAATLDSLDRAAVAYLALPLAIFLLGWFEWWVAAPLVACLAFSLRPLVAAQPVRAARQPPARSQWITAVAVGCLWTVFGGALHLLFANADWLVRDAVLHDLVVSPWPVGYGPLDGAESLLRAPLAFYLPAAVAGKTLGLRAADVCMGIWTAAGASLFLLQVLTLVPARGRVIALTAAVIVLFSGFDIIGNIINTGPRFFAYYQISQHLEWWAGTYQYSSMTTQLFWVPNHALGAWLLIGLMARHRRESALDPLLPMLAVAAALWSPLSAAGAVPFIAWRAYQRIVRGRQFGLLHPKVWAPAAVVGAVAAAYLTLDPGHIAKGVAIGAGGAADTGMDLLRQIQFFLLEAGFIGAAVLWIRRSGDVVLALLVLALLPFAYLGPANDLVMRASIPALVVLAIGACLALADEDPQRLLQRKKVLLLGMLAIGAVTPAQEFARAVVLNAWPLNVQANLIEVSCSTFPPHYIARLGGQSIRHLLKVPHRLSYGTVSRRSCVNPAIDLMWRHGLL